MAAKATSAAAVSKPLYANQSDLPSLPLPSLPETLEKFLKTVRPLATDEEYEHTEALVRDFEGGVGAELQRALEDRASDSRNWLEDWWLEFIYLRPRWPIAVWINYLGASLTNELEPFTMTQPESAAIMAQHILKFRQLVVSETLEPEKLAGRPLCMDQYSRMFNSCRVPGEDCDSIEVFEHDQKHIIVLRNNHILKLNVLDDSGNILPYSDLVHGFQECLRLAATPFDIEVKPPVSVLTSEERNVWAKARQHIIDLDPSNAKSIDTVEKALFCVTLEKEAYTTLEDRSKAALLGSGLNKWYDKPFTMLVFANGITAMNGEHTWADAMVMVKQQDYVMRSIASELKTSGKPVVGAVSGRYAPPELLNFKLDATAHQAIELASVNIAKLISTVDMSVLQFRHFGRSFVKRYSFTPDFFVQMAIQLAHYRVHKEFVATYETGHTRLFYHGRTETVRTLSNESIAFCKAMMDPSVSDNERFEKLKTAIEVHGLYVKDAMLGRGIDRHLLGLQIAAEIQGITPKPALFTDPCFLRSRKFFLSTSNVSVASTSTFGGYSPFFAGGYGICYSLQDNMINACITHIKDTRTDCDKMKGALSEALMDLQKLCLAKNIMYVGTAKL